MIQNLRTIKLRIRNIENTRKITRAMEMVSSVKLNRSKALLHAGRDYLTSLESMLVKLLSNKDRPRHAFLDKRSPVKTIALFIITSDAGLCSVYNYAIIKLAEDFIKAHGPENVKLIAAGKEGANYFKRLGFHILNEYPDLHGRYSKDTSKKISDYLIDLFAKGLADEVYIAYTQFSGMIRHRPVIQKFLNIDAEFIPKENFNYIIEPDADRLGSKLIGQYAAERIRLSILESFTAEHSSRMVAMKMATDNAEDLIEDLTLLRNKVRQASITKEVLEIASGAEAVKG